LKSLITTTVLIGAHASSLGWRRCNLEDDDDGIRDNGSPTNYTISGNIRKEGNLDFFLILKNFQYNLTKALSLADFHEKSW
jgi:hypothetical protein